MNRFSLEIPFLLLHRLGSKTFVAKTYAAVCETPTRRRTEDRRYVVITSRRCPGIVRRWKGLLGTEREGTERGGGGESFCNGRRKPPQTYRGRTRAEWY
eukprot:2522002-Rhodomonas_salina.2